MNTLSSCLFPSSPVLKEMKLASDHIDGNVNVTRKETFGKCHYFEIYEYYVNCGHTNEMKM